MINLMSDLEQPAVRIDPSEIPDAIVDCVLDIDSDHIMSPQERHDTIITFLGSVVHDITTRAHRLNLEAPQDEPRPFRISYDVDHHASHTDVLIAETYRRVGEAKAKAEYERIRHVDPLTGLGNRSFWDSELDKATKAVMFSGDERRVRNSFAVIFIDLNDFGRVNKEHGQLAGDEILQNTAALLIDQLRKEDVAVRIAGDEFAALIQMPFGSKSKDQPDEHELELVRAKIESALNHEHDIDGNVIPISASVGASLIRIGDSPDQVFNRADRDMVIRKQEQK